MTQRDVREVGTQRGRRVHRIQRATGAMNSGVVRQLRHLVAAEGGQAPARQPAAARGRELLRRHGPPQGVRLPLVSAKDARPGRHRRLRLGRRRRLRRGASHIGIMKSRVSGGRFQAIEGNTERRVRRGRGRAQPHHVGGARTCTSSGSGAPRDHDHDLDLRLRHRRRDDPRDVYRLSCRRTSCGSSPTSSTASARPPARATSTTHERPVADLVARRGLAARGILGATAAAGGGGLARARRPDSCRRSSAA